MVASDVGVEIVVQSGTENFSRIQKLRQAVAENPGSAKARMRLGTALVRTRAIKEAETELRKAVELDPQFAEAWVNLGGVLLSQWDFEGCVEANQKALECAPEMTQAHYNKGLGHLYLDQAQAMTDCFQRVVELDREHPGGYYHLAVGQLALGRVDEAKTNWLRASQLGFSPQPEFVKELERKLEEKYGKKAVINAAKSQ